MARAIVSVSDKRGLEELGTGLVRLGYEVVATGGTARALAGAGVPVTAVERLTGVAEMLGGRVKTLHPAVHAGILARRDRPEDMAALAAMEVGPVDVVAVNLYPFRQAVAAGADLAEAVEEIDVGGPAMVRAAAKNWAHVTVVVDPDDYGRVLSQLASGGPSPEARLAYAAKAFAHTAAYDAAVAAYLRERAGAEGPPPELALAFGPALPLRYGENPHQRAALYRDDPAPPGSIAAAVQLGGKELSYNNIADADSAWRLVGEFDRPAAVAVKHATPCGAAVADRLADAFARARDTDPEAIFGGIVALNREVDEETAALLRAIFLEVVVAPAFSPRARKILAERRNLRLLEVAGGVGAGPAYHLQRVGGGMLWQEADRLDLDPERLRTVTRRAPTAAEMEALRFAWKVVKHVRSNAVVLAREGATVGIGGGQVSRVRAVRQAVDLAGERARGSVMASDAFFPMPDGVEAAAAGGVTAVIQPGGSIRDAEVVAACDRAGMAMVFTGVRHFRHA
jgi:phosphoribosylaminoimidazolecarboxamide formyltransferase/IMP cyclohydrolase